MNVHGLSISLSDVAVSFLVMTVFGPCLSAQANDLCVVPDTVYLNYDSADGSFGIDVPDGQLIAALEISSSVEFFVGPKPSEFNGFKDVWVPTKAFRLEPAGMGDHQWPAGTVATGTDNWAEFLTVNAGLLNGGIAEFAACSFGRPPEPSGTVVEAPVNWQTDGNPTLVYNFETGSLRVDNPGERIGAFELRSDSPIFVGPPPSAIPAGHGGAWLRNLAFFVTPDGRQDFEFPAGSVATGVDHLWTHLDLDGTFIGGRPLGTFDLVTIPEPANCPAMQLALLMFALRTRKRSS